MDLRDRARRGSAFARMIVRADLDGSTGHGAVRGATGWGNEVGPLGSFFSEGILRRFYVRVS